MSECVLLFIWLSCLPVFTCVYVCSPVFTCI